MAMTWKQIKSGLRDLLWCDRCDTGAVNVRSEPVKRKRHSLSSSRRRIVAICACCRAVHWLTYGGAKGRRTARAKILN